MKKPLCFFFMVLLTFTLVALTEDLSLSIGNIVRVETQGSGDFRGILYSVGEDRLEILDSEGKIIAIARSQIITATIEKQGDAYFQDAAENRLIVMPTAFGMSPSEFHVTSQEVVAFTGSYGFGSNFTLWGGISIPGAVINAKASCPIDGFGAIAAGSFAGYAWLSSAWAFIPYAIVTVGIPCRHFDLAGGVIFVSDPNGHNTASGIGALAGKFPISRTTALVGESWFILGPEIAGEKPFMLSILPMAVFRIATSRLSWDLGALFPFSYRESCTTWDGLFGDGFVPIPILSLTYRIK